MSISLYDISVASYLQLLGGVVSVLDKGAAYCQEQGIALGEIVETRLRPDMLPFRFQLISVAHHSLGAIQAVQSGSFGPPAGAPEYDYAGLQALIADARAQLEALTPGAINALEGNDVLFQIGDTQLPFTASNFVLSFSHPNVYFHAATAYDILRMRGVPVGKRDFMGIPRMKM